MKEIIDKINKQEYLTQEEAVKLMEAFTSNYFSDVKLTSLLTTMSNRTLTVTELEGFTKVLLHKSKKINLPKNAIDVCGTGGDEKNSINISTLTAIVLSSLNIKVIKHGNYGATSITGSSTILENVGFKFSNSPNPLEEQLHKTNLCYLHAPLFHPTLKNLSTTRKNIGTKTLFNILGPLVNPVQPNYYFTGVYNIATGRLYHNFLQNKYINYAIVHTQGGYDEISGTHSFKLFTNKGEQTVNLPYFFEPLKKSEVIGKSTTEEATGHFIEILKNQYPPLSKLIALNAAYAIHIFTTNEIEISYKEALKNIENGHVFSHFKKIISINNQLH